MGLPRGTHPPRRRKRIFLWALRWIVENYLAGWPASKALRKASRLEEDGKLPEAYKETLRALGILHRRYLDYWNPILMEMKLNATVRLDGLAVAMGAPAPREQIEEVIDAFRMAQGLDGRPLHKDVESTLSELEARVNRGPSRPQ
jgi:hypothetical protein